MEGLVSKKRATEPCGRWIRPSLPLCSAQAHLQIHALPVTEQVDGHLLTDEVVAIDVAQEPDDVHLEALAINPENDVFGTYAGGLSLAGDRFLLPEGELC